MKEKQKIHYSVWKRFVDGIYTCKDIEELLADKKTDRSKDFDEASACLWKTGEEESSSSWEEWISNERQALQIISNYEDRRRSHSIYLVKKWGSIAAAVLLCIVLSVVYFANPADMKVAQYEIHVPYGKRQKVVLPDGTKVILNAGSYMKYPRQFGKEDRYVHFKGEAYFDVKRDEALPFVVKTSRSEVMVLGTEFCVKDYVNQVNQTTLGTTFNLNNYEDSEELQLTLCTGKVLMNFGEEQLKLTPGEQLVLDKTNMHLEREHVNTQNYMLWMQNKLYFNRTPIQEVTRRLERVYNYTIQLDSSFVFNNFLSGTHDNRSLEAVLESIRLATGIKYRKENNSYILYK